MRAWRLKYSQEDADVPTMVNDIQAADADLPVFTQAPLRLADDLAPTARTPAGPRPITISPPSSLSTATATAPRHDSASHPARTVPIASPLVDMSTPPTGVPRIPPTSNPSLPTRAAAAVTAPLPLLEPELVEVVQAVVEQEESRFITDGPHHPMAHLMPQRTKPTEAQVRANELRSWKKKKARRAKVLVVVAAVAIGAFAGPPLAAWVIEAVNEPGTTPDQTDTNSTNSDSSDRGVDGGGVGALLDDIDTLTSIVADNNTVSDDTNTIDTNTIDNGG